MFASNQTPINKLRSPLPYIQEFLDSGEVIEFILHSNSTHGKLVSSSYKVINRRYFKDLPN